MFIIVKIYKFSSSRNLAWKLHKYKQTILSEEFRGEFMDNTKYIALSRQMALWKQMNVVSNNVANMNTTGFKQEDRYSL